MRPALQFVPTTGLAILLQAPPKSGKTTLALQFPNPWVADCEGNLSGPLKWIAEKKPELLKTIDYDIINMDEQGNLIPDDQRWRRLVKLSVDVIKNHPEKKTIVIDNAGNIAKYLEDHILSQKSDSKEKERMTISDWIPFRNLLSKYITDMRAYMTDGRILIVTTHEEIMKDEDSGVLIHRTNIPSKLADSFGGLFSEVWRTEVIEKKVGDVVTRDFYINAMKSNSKPQLGTSLGVPTAFRFKWEDFKKEYVDKYATLTTPK